jgi:hypothetical protein
MFGHEDMFHHTSLDTIDMCDPTEMQRVLGVTLCTALSLSALDEKNLVEFLPLIHSGVLKRQSTTLELLGQLQKEIENKRNKEPTQALVDVTKEEKTFFGYTLLEAEDFYDRNLLKEIRQLFSTNNYHETYLSTIERDLKSWVHSQTYLWQENHQRMNIDLQAERNLNVLSKTYKRLFDGPVPFQKFALVEEKPVMKALMQKAPSLNYGGVFFELMNLLARQFPVEEIASALSLQYNRLFYPSEIHSLLELLIEKGIIKEVQEIT